MQGKHPSCTKSRPSQNCQAHALPLMTVTVHVRRKVQRWVVWDICKKLTKFNLISDDFRFWQRFALGIQLNLPESTHLATITGSISRNSWESGPMHADVAFDVTISMMSLLLFLSGASFYRLGTDWICDQMATIWWVENQLARSVVACTSKTTVSMPSSSDRDCLVKTGKAQRPQSTSEKGMIGLRCTTTNFESGSGIVWRDRGVLPSKSGSEIGWSCQTPLRLSGTGSSRTLSLGWWHGR